MFKPDPAEIARLKRKVEKEHSGEQVRDNHFYAGMFSRTDGIFSDVRKPSEWINEGTAAKPVWMRIRKRLRRREWIEKFFPIRSKKGEIVLLTLNPAQRMIEAEILRRERLGIPVRLQILKARQMGACLSPETRVLTADMRWVPISDLAIGQEVVALDENIPGGRGAQRKMRRAVVQAKWDVHSRALRIVTDHGTIIATPEHRLLMKKRGAPTNIWFPAGKFKVGDKLRKCVMPWGDSTFEDGWMGGIIDGEGHLRGRPASVGGASLAITQLPGAVLDRAVGYYERRGYHHNVNKMGSGTGFVPTSGRVKVPVNQVCIHRIDEIMRVVGQTRPVKHVNGTWWEGKTLPGKRIGSGWAKILSIEELPPQRMIDIQTSTGTFIAEGIVSHNSSYIQAFAFERVLRGRHIRGLIVADTKEHSETLLAIAQIGRSEMVKDKMSKTLWDFRLTSKARDTFRFDEPIVGEVEVTSSEAPSPGRGGTRTLLHLSEAAMFKKADQTYSACVSSLPTIPGTYGFEESTANGSSGRFYKDFWDSYNERSLPIMSRMKPWNAIFFAWWQHPDYFWTRSYGYGRTLSQEKIDEIKKSLTSEEEWLLKQEFIRRWEPTDEWERVRAADFMSLDIEGKGPNAKIVGRHRVHADTYKWRRKGVGWQKVSIDQIAWRREKIQDKDFGGDIDKFNVEYPSRPQVAFLSSGRPVFNGETITRMMSAAKEHPPLFRGTLRKALEKAP